MPESVAPRLWWGFAFSDKFGSVWPAIRELGDGFGVSSRGLPSALTAEESAEDSTVGVESFDSVLPVTEGALALGRFAEELRPLQTVFPSGLLANAVTS